MKYRIKGIYVEDETQTYDVGYADDRVEALAMILRDSAVSQGWFRYEIEEVQE